MRQTGFALLAAGSVQEAQDLAAIAHAATLTSRVPFLHFFDGFRTSHEVAKIELLGDDTLRALLPAEAIEAHRARALTPDHPSLRGTAQNPDTFFQAREASNRFHAACPAHVQQAMDRFAASTGRAYRLFDYVGHPEAERVLVLMGSAAEVAHETVEWLLDRGERVGVVKVRLYRPFDAPALLAALPPTVRALAVLDRTKEPGAVGEPLYLDVVAALAQARQEGRSPLLQEPVVAKGLRLFAIDAYAVARAAGLGVRINTIMQTCFFALSGVLPREEALARIQESIGASYGKRGERVVGQNRAAVDAALAHLHEIPVPAAVTTARRRPPAVSAAAPELVQRVTAVMLAGRGDHLPVSAFPVDGTWPTGTARWEKRNLALEIPIWDEHLCIQCNQCAFVCPHAAIRAKVYAPDALGGAPDGFLSVPARGPELAGLAYTLQVAPEDCTGCQLCVTVCPAKDRTDPRHKAIDMKPRSAHLDTERQRFDFFLELPELDRTAPPRLDAKGSQLLQPLFEFSGACAGCGETPYLKLLTQLYGDRLLIANATGCSSIYGANLPTTPYTVNAEGRGPAWSNSLFEDNAEFGFGFRLAADTQARLAGELLTRLAGAVGDSLATELLTADQSSEAGIAEQRARVAELRRRLDGQPSAEARALAQLAAALVKKSVWLVGGDGWAYDIGFGGLDHLLAMSYGHVYVARIAFGAKYNQTVEALREAESYPGPSLVIAYSHCIAHGYDLVHGVDQQKLAVASGIWPLYRFDPRRAAQGEPPLHLDGGTAAPGAAPQALAQYMGNEARFRIVEKRDPERFRRLAEQARREVARRVAVYEQLSHLTVPATPATKEESP